MMEIERLTKAGTVRIGDTVIQSYPEMEILSLDENDIPNLSGEIIEVIRPDFTEGIETSKFVIEEKVHGANIRVWRYKNELVCLTRGGNREPKTEKILQRGLLRHLASGLQKFFDDNPSLVLCSEIIGKDTVANVNAEWYKEHYGDPAVFLVFDICETGHTGKWFGADEVQKLCVQYGFAEVPRLGFARNGNELLKLMENVKEVNEGAVIKAFPEREKGQVWKLRWEHFSKHFKDRVVKRERPVREPDEASVIFDHFMQGYPQPELGLVVGISPNEKAWYDKALEKLAETVRQDRPSIGKVVGEITENLKKGIFISGKFSDEQKKKITKVIKQRLGREVSQAMAHKAAESEPKDKMIHMDSPEVKNPPEVEKNEKD